MRSHGINGSDNIEQYELTKNGEPFIAEDEGITRIEVKVGDKVITSPHVVLEGNVLSVNYGQLGLKPGSYKPDILVYQGNSTKPKVIVGSGLDSTIHLSIRAL
ncbi:hypothetical protein EYS14_03270 [Alteromonadaceae bacterium M269]|nr:hypothetical protein EYS14_03270 [Alteromonadaceae bacterium M269]